MKNIAIKIAGVPGEEGLKDIRIAPGTTAGEIFVQLDLSDYVHTTGTDSTPFTSDDVVYSKVEDGSKLFALTKTEVAEKRPLFN